MSETSVPNTPLKAAITTLLVCAALGFSGSGSVGDATEVEPTGATGAPESQGRRLADTEWPTYGNDPGGTRYSALRQIKRRNVATLEVAWTYRAGTSRAELTRRRAVSEATPLLVAGRLVYSTPLGRVIALDPATGAELWKVRVESERIGGVTRGVAAWSDSSAAAGERCATRILYPSPAARLYALDVTDGSLCTEFGADGVIDVTDGLRVRDPRGYRLTSPPAVVGDVVVVGSAIADNEVVRETRGFVQGFDLRTGAGLWKWDPLLPTTAAGSPSGRGAKVRAGGANAWSILSADPARDLVFVPTGSASPDHYGGKRPGDNLYANSVVALRASTGERVWHFQLVHHDVWDFDAATQPTLIDYRAGPREPEVPAVVMGSKAGHVFVLDRETGEPLIPVQEVAVPGNGVGGEVLSPTQPVPVSPPSLVDGALRPATVFGLDEADRQWCREQLAGLRDDGLFTPPTQAGSLMYPAETGGMNWGGLAWDPRRRLLIANTTRLAGALRLIRRADYDPAQLAVWQAQNPTVAVGLQRGAPYVMQRELLVTPEGVPCNEPPWGQLAAVDLAGGTIDWQVPLGVTPAVADRTEAADWGARNAGGALVTRGGLVFIAAALDDTIRAFDIRNGRVRWQAELPAGGQATPMTYAVGGRQYLVIVAGGHWNLGTTLGDYVVAFALP